MWVGGWVVVVVASVDLKEEVHFHFDSDIKFGVLLPCSKIVYIHGFFSIDQGC